MSGAIVPLQPNSLYICLTQIMSPGFHWSFFLTNQQGVVRRLQWSEVHGAVPGVDAAEAYQWDDVESVRDYTDDNRLNISFFKIEAYVCFKSETQNGQDVTVWATHEMVTDIFKDIFQSLTTVRDNRQAGITCRTWAMAALQRLRESGFIKRTQEQIQAWEEEIKTIGLERERTILGTSTVETII